MLMLKVRKNILKLLIQYQLIQGGLKREDLQTEHKFPPLGSFPDQVMELMRRVMVPGLSRLPRSLTGEFQQLAVAAGTLGLPNIENQLRGLGSQLDYFFKGNVLFSRTETFERLVRLYFQVETLKGCGETDERRLTIAGETRSVYTAMPPLELMGMGAELWETQSGYAGVTCYFVDPAAKRWYTYSHSRPVYYENSRITPAALYRGAGSTGDGPVGSEISLAEFSRSHARVFPVKVNGENRLSTGRDTKIILHGKTCVTNECLCDMIIHEWALLRRRVREHVSSWLFPRERRLEPMVLRVARWERGRFDDIAQVFRCKVYDQRGDALRISVPYAGHTKQLIAHMEKRTETGRLPDFLLVRVVLSERDLSLFPIAAYGMEGGVLNWAVR